MKGTTAKDLYVPLFSAPKTRRFWHVAASLLVLFATSKAWSQTIVYADYPQKRGKVEPLVWSGIPKWMTVAVELRGRVEGQTSYNYSENGDRTYVLTRAYGSIEVRPTRFLTAYAQFIDTHALGLPLHAVASNMRDVFDARQGYLELHGKAAIIPLDFFAGRQELKFGSERVVGISDWTNNSRSWDGFDLRVGGKNRVDLFSTSRPIYSVSVI